MKFVIAIGLAVALMAPMSSEASYIKEWKDYRSNHYSYNRDVIKDRIKDKLEKVHDYVKKYRSSYNDRTKHKYKKYVKYKRDRYKKKHKVPEPGTVGLMALGLLGLGLARRRARANSFG